LGTPLLPKVKGIEMPLSDQESQQGHFDFLVLGFFVSLNHFLSCPGGIVGFLFDIKIDTILFEKYTL